MDDRKLVLEKIRLLEAQQELASGLPHLYGWNWYGWAREFFECKTKIGIITAANQISKAVILDEIVPTPSGFCRFGDLEPGDVVFARDGSPTRVTAIPFRGEDECYEFEFHDGSKVVTSKNHRWVAKDPERRFRKIYKKGKKAWANPSYLKWGEYSTEEIASSYSSGTAQPSARFSFPVADPVQLPAANLPIDPYFMGLILGDGCLKSTTLGLVSMDAEILRVCEKFGGKYFNSKRNKENHAKNVHFPLELRNKFRDLGLSKFHGSFEKFIPEIYFSGSIEQRLELLRGLMDTDGTITAQSVVSFTTVSPSLREGIERLATSLGMVVQAKIRKTGYRKNGVFKKCRDAFHITIKSHDLNPFRLARKKNRFYNTRYANERVLYRVTKVGKKPCMCITVAHSSGTFLVTKNHLVTHNSSSLIRKNIEWAGNTKLWPFLWRSSPKIFWYFYPSMDVATVEVEKKWVPEFLPRGSFKDHPTYGWRLEYKYRKIHAIHFNSGVTIYFKSYEQSVMNLQASSVYMISIDEELPTDFWDELYMRTNAVDGYIMMVFTATIGQEFWRRVMECRDTPQELLPEASKWQVSMYDCLKYDDGTDTPWSIEKIKRVERSCQSQAEILKRVYGRFVVASGLKYPGFDSIKNMKIGGELPKEWLITGAVDIGGGGTGHPSAISFIGIQPDYQKARIIRLWRGDGIVTTAGDALLKYIDLRDEVERRFGRKIHRQFYDWASKDFQTIAIRMGESFEQADKDHVLGEQVMNTLFQNDMMSIDAECGVEGDKLSVELATIQKDMAKNKCKDDLTDSVRYNVTKAPWDFSVLANFTMEAKELQVGGVDELSRAGKLTEDEYRSDREKMGISGDEFQEWNELY